MYLTSILLTILFSVHRQIHKLILISTMFPSSNSQWIQASLMTTAIVFKYLLFITFFKTGKSHLVKTIIAFAIENKYDVLVATPTALLADRYRQCFSTITCKTIHSAFLIPVEDSPWEINWHISWFQLIVVDEIGQVNSHIIKHIMKTFDALPSNPIIIFLGDAHQSLPLITVQGKTNFDSSFFSSLMTRLFKKFELHTSHRSTTLYKEFLDKIRSFNITFDEIKRIFEHTKIPSTNKVTGERILAIITENPNTIYIASSHKTKDFINKTVMNYLFRDEEPDIEASISTYSNFTITPTTNINFISK
ncbi:uncharacterized protein LOC130629913 [Hydractinia symbiolongicarpus]|uniref:uncharacterized protein LOC130629913 n=1 Tax=Hydractinia symbiolongicarpus TaxID=13093 RepID=UPI00254A6B5A|nr:uncharacterized protein LOC130629913 [Hydractinia symbiolongicarpus]